VATTVRSRVPAVGQPATRRATNTTWQRFRRHRLALAGLVVLAVFCLAALLAWGPLPVEFTTDN